MIRSLARLPVVALLGALAPQRSNAPVAQQPSAPAIRLHMVSALRLNGGAELAGADIADNGSVVWWLRTAPTVISSSTRRHHPDTLCRALVRRPFAAAYMHADSVVEIVDAALLGDGVRILLSAPGGRCSVTAVPPVRGHLLSAARTGAGWVLGLQGEFGYDEYIGLTARGSGVRWREPAATDAAAATQLRVCSLVGSGLGFLSSSMAWPFRTVLIDSTGTKRLQFQAAPAQGEADSMWVGLGTVHLASGFLQTLADSRSDRRALVVFDSLGVVVRRSEIETAFGVLAASPRGRFLAALRRTDFDELVTYEVLGNAAANGR